MTARFSPAEIARYARQLVLPELGLRGQEKLKNARVLIVGAGGLGTPAALYLAGAGVGRIGLVDADEVQVSNLHRQILYRTEDAGRAKVDVARDELARLNPHCLVEAHRVMLTAANAAELIARYDVVVDGSDNLATRYAVNDACRELGRPMVYGAVYRFEGQLGVFNAPGEACYRCLFPEVPAGGEVANCQMAGVLGVLPGVVGALQALEAIKLLTGVGQPLVGRLLLVDLAAMSFRSIKVPRLAECSCRGMRRASPPPASAPTVATDSAPLSARELAALLASPDAPGYQLLDVRTRAEFDQGHIAGFSNFPVSDLLARVAELDHQGTIILCCKSGARSRMVREILSGAGIRARDLDGGVIAWRRDIEPTLPIA